MKIALLALSCFLLSVLPGLAQVSPTPVTNNEIRDNSSIRMREITLERAKREASRAFRNESTEEGKIRFEKIGTILKASKNLKMKSSKLTLQKTK